MDITTASRPPRAAASTAIAEMMPVTGTCPLQEAELGGAQQLRVDLPPGPQHRQPADRGRPLDRREPVTRAADDEERDVAGPLADALHGHDRVDAAAEGDKRAQAALPLAVSLAVRRALAWPSAGAAGRVRGLRRLDAQVAEVEAVAVGVLAQARQVELAQEGPLAAGQRGVAEVDHRRRGRLVIGDAREQVDEPRGGAGRGRVPGGAGRERHPFRELPPVERVPAGQQPPVGVGGEPFVPEDLPARGRGLREKHLAESSPASLARPQASGSPMRATRPVRRPCASAGPAGPCQVSRVRSAGSRSSRVR